MVDPKKNLAVCALLLTISWAPQPAFAGTATEQLRNTIQDFVGILTATPVVERQATGLPEAARKLVFARFDFAEMTRLSLGQHWLTLEVSEQAEFVAALAQRILITCGRTVPSGGENIQYKARSRTA